MREKKQLREELRKIASLEVKLKKFEEPAPDSTTAKQLNIAVIVLYVLYQLRRPYIYSLVRPYFILMPLLLNNTDDNGYDSKHAMKYIISD